MENEEERRRRRVIREAFSSAEYLLEAQNPRCREVILNIFDTFVSYEQTSLSAKIKHFDVWEVPDPEEACVLNLGFRT